MGIGLWMDRADDTGRGKRRFFFESVAGAGEHWKGSGLWPGGLRGRGEELVLASTQRIGNGDLDGNSNSRSRFNIGGYTSNNSTRKNMRSRLEDGLGNECAAALARVAEWEAHESKTESLRAYGVVKGVSSRRRKTPGPFYAPSRFEVAQNHQTELKSLHQNIFTPHLMPRMRSLIVIDS